MYSVKKRFSTTEDNRRYKIFRKEGYQMDERLTQEQRELVEKNLTVIDCVIRSCVHANNNICGMEYDDLYQIGAIGLCKAASRYKQCKQAAFST